MVDPVRPLVLIAAGEAIAGLALTIAVLTSGLTSGSGAVGLVAEVVMWVLATIALWLVWLGLYRRRAIARTPFLLAQAFGIVVASAVGSSDLWAYRILGVALGAAALVGLVLGLRPAAHAALH